MNGLLVFVFVINVCGLSAFHSDNKASEINDHKLFQLLRKELESFDKIYTEKPGDEDFENDAFNGIKFKESDGLYIYMNPSTPPDTAEQEDDTSPLDSWSVVWYIASFGGLIVFFVVVSCSEWCCRRHARRNCQRNNGDNTNPIVSDTPPPSYEQFAPPSYESLCYTKREEKSEFDIYVVPVEALSSLMGNAEGLEDAPPSYINVSSNDGQVVPAYPLPNQNLCRHMSLNVQELERVASETSLKSSTNNSPRSSCSSVHVVCNTNSHINCENQCNAEATIT